jgi:hypothetical protein
MNLRLITSLNKKQTEFSVINNKPGYCNNCCRLSTQSYGFVRDWLGKQPLLAVLGIIPTSGELANGIWESEMFFYLLKTFFEPLGLTKENLVLSNVLRCQPKEKDWKEDHAYPKEALRKHSEQSCRYHDIAFHSFDPNIFISTFDIYAIRKLDANKVLFKADLEKAKRFIDKGYKPCLLLGEEPLHLVAPHLGGVKTWRGHWWEGSWKWEPGKEQVIPENYVGKSPVKMFKLRVNNNKKPIQTSLF